MALKPSFSRQARRQIAAMAKRRPELLERVVEVVAHLIDEPFAGLHKPEPLSGPLTGYWSVRLNRRDRVIYRVEGKRLLIESVEGHYGNR